MQAGELCGLDLVRIYQQVVPLFVMEYGIQMRIEWEEAGCADNLIDIACWELACGSGCLSFPNATHIDACSSFAVIMRSEVWVILCLRHENSAVQQWGCRRHQLWDDAQTNH